MKTRRITLALGAAAGGLLAAAFLPLAVANADSGDVIDVTSDAMRATPPDFFGFSPDSSETVLTVSGLPPLYQQVEGYQTFDYVTPKGDDLGSFNADVSKLTTPGFENIEYLITGDDPTAYANADMISAPTESFPTDGSVYDIANFGNGFENVYSDVLPEQAQRLATDSLTGIGTAAPGTITDTFVTPFGNIDLTPLVDGFSTAVTGGDFLTTIDPGSVDLGSVDLGSILGSFGDVLQMF
ncbi:MAG: hypothetical protein WB967_23635 [Mycobacterium sp.]|uniref:hypothetical protein n=1 Tax=Mycobacterium sp. TaxID=1785 RepID=UPI003C51B6BA